MGVYNICKTEKSQREYKIEKVQIHELYYTKKPYYDISLLTLAGETDAYMPICLPDFGKLHSDKDIYKHIIFFQL